MTGQNDDRLIRMCILWLTGWVMGQSDVRYACLYVVGLVGCEDRALFE